MELGAFLTVRMRRDILETLQKQAAAEDRKPSALARRMIEQAIEDGIAASVNTHQAAHGRADSEG
jgi:predicted transcriptional regulator